MRVSTVRWSVLGGLLVLLATSATARMTIEPKGFGEAHFGMSPSQVKKLYPHMRVLGRENLGATPLLSPYVVRQLLPAEKVDGLSKPVPVELRYWKNQLWVVVVYYAANSTADVVAYLKELVGDPHNPDPEPMWRDDKVTVSAANRERWFAISDNALSREVQSLFKSELQKKARAKIPESPAPSGGQRAPAAHP